MKPRVKDPEYITVLLCVNDPQNGMPTGYVCGAHFGDGEIDLEGDPFVERDNPTYSVDHAKQRMRIGRHVYPIHGHKMWYGNWCWDGVTMTREDAKRLVRRLLARGFTIDGGWVETDLDPTNGAAA